jgi:FKBP-type peptidyl-prolyl cis-trans isomerase FklB
VVTRRFFRAFERCARRHPVRLAASLVTALGAGFVPVYAQQGAASPPGATSQAHPHHHASSSSAADEKSQGSYSLGVLMGLDLRRYGLSPSAISFEKFQQGLKDSMSGKTKGSTQDQQYVQALILHSQHMAASTNRVAAQKFLAENGKRQGVRTTPSGLEYKVLNEGSGPSPKPSDTVTVNYRGTLLDGTEFDSSYKRGQPATFQVDRIIKGWQEALVLMKPGAKWELYVPPDLAYGDNAPGGLIPPGALLKFEVELLKVAPPAPPSGAAPGALPKVAPGTAGGSGR